MQKIQNNTSRANRLGFFFAFKPPFKINEATPESDELDYDLSLTWKEVPLEIKKLFGSALMGEEMSILIGNLSSIVLAIVNPNPLILKEKLEKIGLSQYEILIRENIINLVTGVTQKVKNVIIPLYEVKKMQEVCKKNKLRIGFIPKGSNRTRGIDDSGQNRGFENTIFLDVNDGEFDHKGSDSTGTTEVLKNPQKIVETKGPKHLVSHFKSDLDSVVCVALYVKILNEELKGDEPILEKFKNYVEAYDLGQWQELNFEKVGLSYIVEYLRLGAIPDLKIQEISYEIIDRIIKKDLDPTNLKSIDFMDMKIKKKKRSVINIGELIDSYEVERKKNLKDFYKKVEFYEFLDGTEMVYIKNSKLSKFEIYQLGYSMVFDSVSFGATQEWADENQELMKKAHKKLERQEQIVREQMAAQNLKYNTPEFLRKENPRLGYNNSNPWFMGETGCQFVQPSVQMIGDEKIRSVLSPEIIFEILQDVFQFFTKDQAVKETA